MNFQQSFNNFPQVEFSHRFAQNGNDPFRTASSAEAFRKVEDGWPKLELNEVGQQAELHMPFLPVDDVESSATTTPRWISLQRERRKQLHVACSEQQLTRPREPARQTTLPDLQQFSEQHPEECSVTNTLESFGLQYDRASADGILHFFLHDFQKETRCDCSDKAQDVILHHCQNVLGNHAENFGFTDKSSGSTAVGSERFTNRSRESSSSSQQQSRNSGQETSQLSHRLFYPASPPVQALSPALVSFHNSARYKAESIMGMSSRNMSGSPVASITFGEVTSSPPQRLGQLIFESPQACRCQSYQPAALREKIALRDNNDAHNPEIGGNDENSSKTNNSVKEENHPFHCKPCAFHWTKGCRNSDCSFCHEWHPRRRKKAMKNQKNLMVIARANGKMEFLRCNISDALGT